MKTLNEKCAEVIQMFPSVFSKEDVVKIVTEVYEDFFAIKEDVQPAGDDVLVITREQLSSAVKGWAAEMFRSLEGDLGGVIDEVECDFEIDYDNRIQVSSVNDVTFHENQFERLTDQLTTDLETQVWDELQELVKEAAKENS